MIVDRRQTQLLVDALTKYVNEVPNDELVASMKEAQNLKDEDLEWHDNVDAFMDSLLK